MNIKKNALEIKNAPREQNIKNALARSSAGKEISSMPKDVIKHVRMLLIQNDLSLEDIIKKYREIVDMKLKGTRVSDVVKVLENVQKIHLSELSTLDALQSALDNKNEEEIAEYTQVTLKKTEIILQRLKARRINSNAPERSSTS